MPFQEIEFTLEQNHESQVSGKILHWGGLQNMLSKLSRTSLSFQPDLWILRSESNKVSSRLWSNNLQTLQIKDQLTHNQASWTPTGYTSGDHGKDTGQSTGKSCLKQTLQPN